MTEERENMSLANLAGGAAIERFDAELAEKVLPNLRDPNVPWKGPRAITLKVVFRTDEERRALKVALTCVSSIPPMHVVTTEAEIGLDETGRLAAREAVRQQSLFDRDGKPAANVLPIIGENGKNA